MALFDTIKSESNRPWRPHLLLLLIHVTLGLGTVLPVLVLVDKVGFGHFAILMVGGLPAICSLVAWLLLGLQSGEKQAFYLLLDSFSIIVAFLLYSD